MAFHANAGSDGELVLKKDQPEKIKDCFENLNRATFSFNQSLDKALIKPIAKRYKNLPDPIQKGTGNAARNLSNLITIPNNILQGDVRNPDSESANNTTSKRERAESLGAAAFIVVMPNSDYSTFKGRMKFYMTRKSTILNRNKEC